MRTHGHDNGDDDVNELNLGWGHADFIFEKEGKEFDGHARANGYDSLGQEKNVRNPPSARLNTVSIVPICCCLFGVNIAFCFQQQCRLWACVLL